MLSCGVVPSGPSEELLRKSALAKHAREVKQRNAQVQRVKDVETGPVACVHLLQGLYLLDMSTATPVAKQLEVGGNDPSANFCEVKWCSNTGRLVAATGQSTSFELLECRV